MKFYAATLTKPVTLTLIDFGDNAEEQSREFPAGTKVSATPLADIGGREGRWHLNHNPETFVTWDGYADTDQLEVGEVIATANEPETRGSER